jgi:hypothetical protein
MPSFFNPVDNLGWHIDGAIELISDGGGGRKEPSEQLGRNGLYVPGAAKTIRLKYERTAVYSLIDPTKTLEMKFGELIGVEGALNYLLTGANLTLDNGLRGSLSVTYVKLPANNMFNATDTKKFSVTVPCGFGVVDLLGCTVASPGEAVKGSLQVSTSPSFESGATSGSFQQAGFALGAYRLLKSLSATGEITLPTGVSGVRDLQPQDDSVGNGAKIYAVQWFDYPTLTS